MLAEDRRVISTEIDNAQIEKEVAGANDLLQGLEGATSTVTATPIESPLVDITASSPGFSSCESVEELSLLIGKMEASLDLRQSLDLRNVLRNREGIFASSSDAMVTAIESIGKTSLTGSVEFLLEMLRAENLPDRVYETLGIELKNQTLLSSQAIENECYELCKSLREKEGHEVQLEVATQMLVKNISERTIKDISKNIIKEIMEENFYLSDYPAPVRMLSKSQLWSLTTLGQCIHSKTAEKMLRYISEGRVPFITHITNFSTSILPITLLSFLGNTGFAVHQIFNSTNTGLIASMGAAAACSAIVSFLCFKNTRIDVRHSLSAIPHLANFKDSQEKAVTVSLDRFKKAEDEITLIKYFIGHTKRDRKPSDEMLKNIAGSNPNVANEIALKLLMENDERLQLYGAKIARELRLHGDILPELQQHILQSLLANKFINSEVNQLLSDATNL